MTLVQDGVSYPVASTALGVGEFSCTATKTTARFNLGFYGNGLHPGTGLTSPPYRVPAGRRHAGAGEEQPHGAHPGRGTTAPEARTWLSRP